MILHNNIESFKNIISQCSMKLGYTPVEIEKDYYVTLFLKEISTRYPNLIFKGGTSLSKCYKVINRFSEDIDLNIDCDRKPTNGQRQKLIKTIKSICLDFNFAINNLDKIQSRRNFNQFIIDTNSLYCEKHIKRNVIIEVALQTRSFPNEIKDCSSFIYQYLKNINRNDLIDKYDLKSFKIKVQSIKRTFVDKIFAVCDYYLNNRIEEYSRHLYDLYKLINHIKFDEEFIKLFYLVKHERSLNKKCISSNLNVPDCLNEVINKDVYKNDYNNNTKLFIYDNVSYKTAKDNIINIIKILQKLGVN